MASHRSADATVSADTAVAVTVSDATVIPVTRALYIGVGGNLNVRMANGGDALFLNVAAGIFPIQVDMVYDASTTADSMFALY
jgi:hypothetical protein